MSDDWEFLGPRVCIVSSWLPARDGIARYAEPLAVALSASHEVRRVGFLEACGVRVHVLHRGLRALKLVRDTRGFDDVLVQYHPHYYVRGSWPSRLASYASWAALVRLRRVSFVVHEADDLLPDEIGRRGRLEFWLEERVRRLFWKRAARIVFLSSWQRDSFTARFPAGERRTISVAEHGALFSAAASASQPDARTRLGLKSEPVVVLMIGFLSASNPDKGYDRALRALAEAGDARVDLHIVGSPIREHAEIDELLASLRAAAAHSRHVHLLEQWLSDEEFDLWILAADAVLLPYRNASSSGVAARARLLGTRIVTSGTGGLSEQAGARDIVARTDEELAAAISRVADEAAAERAAAGA